MLLRLLSSAEVEGVAREGERHQLLRAIGEEAEPAMGGRRVQLEMDISPSLQVLSLLPLLSSDFLHTYHAFLHF